MFIDTKTVQHSKVIGCLLGDLSPSGQFFELFVLAAYLEGKGFQVDDNELYEAVPIRKDEAIHNDPRIRVEHFNEDALNALVALMYPQFADTGYVAMYLEYENLKKVAVDVIDHHKLDPNDYQFVELLDEPFLMVKDMSIATLIKLALV